MSVTYDNYRNIIDNLLYKFLLSFCPHVHLIIPCKFCAVADFTTWYRNANVRYVFNKTKLIVNAIVHLIYLDCNCD